ncbi:MAG: hypothetical protein ABI338_03100 [Gemmatimonadaceae bacterium]
MRRCRHVQLKAYLAAIAVVAGIAACGGGASDSPTPPGDPSAPSTPTGPTVMVSLGVDVPSQAVASDTVAVGGTVQASAVAITTAGHMLTGLPVRWSITAGTATVAQSGLVTTTSAGRSSVTATFQPASGAATLQATAVP